MKNVLVIMLVLLCGSAFAQISFKDSSGQTVTLDKQPAKVVVLNSSNLEMYFAAGGTPAAYAMSSTTPVYIENRLKGLPNVGRVENPDIERIVAMNPDLVIGMNFPFHVALRSSLNGAGIKVALFSPVTLPQVKETVQIFGNITGNKAKAAESIADIDDKLKNVQDRLKGVKKVRALVLYGSPESYNMALPDSYAGMMLDMAGGDNIAAGTKADKNGPMAGSAMSRGFAPVSLENIAMQNPDYIFLINHDNKTQAKNDSSLTKHPAWSGLSAVKNGRVVSLPFETYGNNPTVRTGDAVLRLAKMMYPEQFK
ncbi:ABC transporter substrate-binding protein [Seleniivibrio sp.]|uniref:ABC transporter substrate-binding protein n=1 Tax=Seleniivibrio sp. TaxID=2898801 RepID=UPI0025CD5F34|nr:ABC transporter substrate-binding protein [Seleniivibrio sp.]MCD8553500.1 ABC transporter substrate-binding protein [Seleniivibrio sp.]